MQPLERLKPPALLLLRCGLGIIFVYHGYPKLFGDRHLYLDAFVRFGFPSYFAYLAGVVELLGGCLLILGLITRLAGLLLAGEMAIATLKVHLSEGVLALNEYQFPLALAVGAFTLVATGAGFLSLDHIIFKQKTQK
jgi:putative oxidoreductase